MIDNEKNITSYQNMLQRWTNKMMVVLDSISSWSKDKTQTSAIITDENFCIISTGYNGFPRGVDDTPIERHQRPTKYLYSEHSERNAIYQAAKNGISTKGKYMFMKWYPCSSCARAIIQSGISTLICSKPDFDTAYWGDDFVASHNMLNESNIIVYYLEDLGLEVNKYER